MGQMGCQDFCAQYPQCACGAPDNPAASATAGTTEPMFPLPPRRLSEAEIRRIVREEVKTEIASAIALLKDIGVDDG